METHTRLGAFDDVVDGTTDEVSAIAVRLRSVIEELPDCVEVPRPGERSAAYGVGPKKMSDEAYAYVMPQSGYVNLGFYHGAALTEFTQMLKGSGKRLRYIKIRTRAEADLRDLRRLLQAARREREIALGLE